LLRILYFASPFFQAVLDGDWKETHPSLHSLSDAEDDKESTTSAEEGIKKTNLTNDSEEEDLSPMTTATSPRASFYTAHFSFDQIDASTEEDEMTKETSESEVDEVVSRLQRLATPPPFTNPQESVEDTSTECGNETYTNEKAHIAKAVDRGQKSKKSKRKVVAIIDLSEEEASTFQDFLFLVYPSKHS
jgi:hypothetical protein